MPRSYFPPRDIDDCLVIARTILEANGGKPMKRLTLFDTIGKSPESGPSRELITASGSYGLTRGGYQAEEISLTPVGRQVAEGTDPNAKARCVLGVKVFSAFLRNYDQAVVPTQAAGHDFLIEQKVPESQVSRCYEILVNSARQSGIVREISGKERIMLPALPATPEAAPVESQSEEATATQTSSQSDGTQVGGILDAKATVPSLHIDIQIHIAADASSVQIESIFKSMARYLYGRNVGD